MIGRRGFIGGMIGLVAAPAIVQAVNLMPIRALRPASVMVGGNSLLTVEMITREAMQLFKNSNMFLQTIDSQYIDSQYDAEFGLSNAAIGSTLRIRLPNDYSVIDRTSSTLGGSIDSRLAIAAAAPLVVAKALEAPVTRRFWAA